MPKGETKRGSVCLLRRMIGSSVLNTFEGFVWKMRGRNKEAQTEFNGAYNVRGLHPMVIYAI